MMTTLGQFVDQYQGQQLVDNQGRFKGECVSLVKRYAQEVQGISNADAVLYVVDDLAKNMYLNPTTTELQYYATLPPTTEPQVGDIAVYDGREGDVAVYIGNNQVFGQLGNPVYKLAAVRPLGNPIGYVRLKGDDMYNGQTAQYWYEAAQNATYIANLRDSFVNQLCLAAGVNPDHPLDQNDVNKAVANIDGLNKQVAAGTAKVKPYTGPALYVETKK